MADNTIGTFLAIKTEKLRDLHNVFTFFSPIKCEKLCKQ